MPDIPTDLAPISPSSPVPLSQRFPSGRWKTGWDSTGHLQAMLNPDADSLGVGVTVEQGVAYCYLLLGDPTTNNPYG